MPSGHRAVFTAILLLASFGAPATLAATARVPASAARHEAPGPRCGGTLWRLMTLSDPGAGQVELHGVPTTIAEIAKLKPPARIGSRTKDDVPAAGLAAGRRRRPIPHRVERRDRARALQHRHGAVHERVSRESALPRQAHARPHRHDRGAESFIVALSARVTAAGSCSARRVDLAGVGFWNPSKATRGALPNGAELRPLTNFKIVSGCGVG